MIWVVLIWSFWMREMGKKLGLLVWVWFMLCGLCVGRFVVEKNSLKVTSPSSLNGVYECAIGNFGVPQYGGTMVGTVVYPKANHKACNDFDISFKSKPGGLPTFLLADRGGQFFNWSYTLKFQFYFQFNSWLPF